MSFKYKYGVLKREGFIETYNIGYGTGNAY